MFMKRTCVFACVPSSDCVNTALLPFLLLRHVASICQMAMRQRTGGPHLAWLSLEGTELRQAQFHLEPLGIFVWLLDWLNHVEPEYEMLWTSMSLLSLTEFKTNCVHNCPTSRLCHWFILLEFAPHSGIQGAIVEVIWKKQQKGTEKPRRT